MELATDEVRWSRTQSNRYYVDVYDVLCQFRSDVSACLASLPRGAQTVYVFSFSKRNLATSILKPRPFATDIQKANKRSIDENCPN